ARLPGRGTEQSACRPFVQSASLLRGERSQHVSLTMEWRRGSMIKLMRFMKPYRMTLVLVLVLAFAQSFANLYLPTLMADIVDNGVVKGDKSSTTLQQSLTQLITSAVTLVGVIVLMLTISPLLSLVVVLTLPLSLLITMGLAKRSQNYFRRQQRALGILNDHVEEMYTGHKIVKAFGHEGKSMAEFRNLNENLYNAGWRAQFVSGMIMPLMRFVGNLGYVIVAVVGGIMVTNGSIAIGDVQAFIQYAQQFTQPITSLANIANV